MNMYLIIGLILVLVGVLVYSRRKRSADAADDISPVAAVPASSPSPSASLAPAPQAPLPRPAALRDDIAPAPVHAPPPSNWIPEETIVEPGWPLPGEISGNWSPVTTETGAAGAVRDEAAVTTAVVETPAPEPTPVAAADEWLMPESPGMTWPAPAEEVPVAVAAAPVEPAFAAESAATSWDPPVAEMDTPVWTPPPAPPATWPVEEPEAASVAAAEPAPAPLAEPEPPAPVVWNLDPPVAPLAPEPEVAFVADPPPPVAEEWIAPLPEAAPEPVVAPPPAPVVIAPEPELAAFVAPEPEVPASIAPEPEIAVFVAPEPADIRDQSLAVADLAPLLGSLLPLTRVSDRTGVTPRMLALMRALADGPLSVTEQARRLDVSRPVVADLSARLESQGLACRERDAADRRRVRIALTERGRRFCDEAPATDPAAIEAALARMAPGERDGLLRGVRALERVAAAR